MDRPPEISLVENEDYYLEAGLMVLTDAFLRRRGYCCESGCRHCPYGYRRDGPAGGTETPEG